MKALFNNVIVEEPVEDESTTSAGGIILQEKKPSSTDTVVRTILTVGEDVPSQLKPGVDIIISPHLGRVYKIGDSTVRLIEDKTIIALA